MNRLREKLGASREDKHKHCANSRVELVTGNRFPIPTESPLSTEKGQSAELDGKSAYGR